MSAPDPFAAALGPGRGQPARLDLDDATGATARRLEALRVRVEAGEEAAVNTAVARIRAYLRETPLDSDPARSGQRHDIEAGKLTYALLTYFHAEAAAGWREPARALCQAVGLQDLADEQWDTITASSPRASTAGVLSGDLETARGAAEEDVFASICDVLVEQDSRSTWGNVEDRGARRRALNAASGRGQETSLQCRLGPRGEQPTTGGMYHWLHKSLLRFVEGTSR